jgi:hypothetical protein
MSQGEPWDTIVHSHAMVRCEQMQGAFMRFVVAVLLLSACCFGQKEDVLRGSAWRDYSEQFKGGYITGYIHAMGLAQFDFLTTCMSIKDVEAHKVCHSNMQSLDFDSITVGQFLDGMNKFYKDFRNLQVPLTMAMGLVRDEIRGRSEEDVQKELDSWRGCVAGDFRKCFPAAKANAK